MKDEKEIKKRIAVDVSFVMPQSLSGVALLTNAVAL
jgi:hypothetical protein